MEIKNFLKEYFSPVPLVGGLLTAGLVGTTTFLIGLVTNANQSFGYALNGKNPLDAIVELYNNSGGTAGKYLMPGEMIGQFLGYKFQKSFTNLFKKKR